MTNQSRRHVMERVADDQVNLATLQALCLLSMNDFAGVHLPRLPTLSGSI